MRFSSYHNVQRISGISNTHDQFSVILTMISPNYTYLPPSPVINPCVYIFQLHTFPDARLLLLIPSCILSFLVSWMSLYWIVRILSSLVNLLVLWLILLRDWSLWFLSGFPCLFLPLHLGSDSLKDHSHTVSFSLLTSGSVPGCALCLVLHTLVLIHSQLQYWFMTLVLPCIHYSISFWR